MNFVMFLYLFNSAYQLIKIWLKSYPPSRGLEQVIGSSPW